jgi:RHS repeat-associated protein
VDGAMTAGYTYNGNGQRVKKTVNGVTTVFHYSLSGQIIAESNSAGTISAEYVYLNGQPLAKIEGANVYYYHNDHLATPQKMTDSSGSVVWAADYKPFGEATVTVSTITSNLRFPGQYFDAETGLLYNLNRVYNSSLGRYNEADPIGLAGGDVNIYRYVMNNPLTNVDEEGLLCKNKKSATSPMGAWTGTDMPTGPALAALECIEKCAGLGKPWLPFPEDNGTSCSPYDLQITGGSECYGKKHTPKSKAKISSHCTNQAFDLPPGYNNMKIKCCAKKCGIKYIEDETNHLHMQTTGGGGNKNILPSDKECCSIK